MSDQCMLKEGPFYQCCCNCEYHWQDNYHCTTHPEVRDANDGNCVCSKKKGYACVVFKVIGPEDGMIHSGWPEHSTGCEMYRPRKHLEAERSED